jgi:hypothetical protein
MQTYVLNVLVFTTSQPVLKFARWIVLPTFRPRLKHRQFNLSIYTSFSVFLTKLLKHSHKLLSACGSFQMIDSRSTG